MNTLSDVIIALIRTIVPVTVGALITWLALPASTGELVTLFATVLLTASYYAAVRALSSKWAWFGWLLGYPADPSYKPEPADAYKPEHAAD